MPNDRARLDHTVELEEGLAIYEGASSSALSRLADLGLDPVSDRPKYKNNSEFDGRLPANVNSLSASELGEIYGVVERYFTWISGYATIAKADMKNKDEQLKLVRARIRKSKTGTAADKDDEVICDERYVHANSAAIEAEEYYLLLSGLTEATLRDTRYLSRLIELKKIEFEQGTRGANVTSRDAFRAKPKPRP